MNLPITPNQMNAALATFVKTPGYSPVKTRLAVGIGETASLEFYELALNVAAELMENISSRVTPHWAVAEAECARLPRWQNFPVIAQSGSDLGERLFSIADRLLQNYSPVILIGADSPSTRVADITAALESLKTHDYVVGLANDGGFYLLGSCLPIEKSAWTDITYSTDRTGMDLVRSLRGLGKVDLVPSQADVDNANDLLRLRSALEGLPDRLRSQDKLLEWLRRQ